MFIKGIDFEGTECLVPVKDIKKIMLLKYDYEVEREFPFVVTCILVDPASGESEWITLGEYQTEAAAQSKFTQLERDLGQ